MKTILITGANRGIGLEFTKQLNKEGHQVIATCRNPDEAHALQELVHKNQSISIYKLDVTDDNNLHALLKELKDIKLDWLINNAGISGESGVTVGNIERDNFLHVLNVNCLSPLKVSEAFLPLLYKGEDKLIVCISSAMGSITENQRGRSYAYRTSKAALNCVMRSFALDAASDGIKVLLLHPGWVKTRMGGSDALLPAEESVHQMLQVIEEHKKNSHAEILRGYDNRTIQW